MEFFKSNLFDRMGEMMTISNLSPIPVQEIAAREEENYEEDVDNIILGEEMP